MTDEGHPTITKAHLVPIAQVSKNEKHFLQICILLCVKLNKNLHPIEYISTLEMLDPSPVRSMNLK